MKTFQYESRMKWKQSEARGLGAPNAYCSIRIHNEPEAFLGAELKTPVNGQRTSADRGGQRSADVSGQRVSTYNVTHIRHTHTHT